MSVTILGTRTIGECVPAALSVNGKLLATIQARLAGAVALQARLTVTPPSLAASIAAAGNLLANLRVAPPGATLNLTSMIAVITDLGAQVQSAIALNLAFGTGGVTALLFDGKVGAMGGELDASVGTLFPPTNDAVALVLIASDPATKIAMNLVFGVSF